MSLRIFSSFVSDDPNFGKIDAEIRQTEIRYPPRVSIFIITILTIFSWMLVFLLAWSSYKVGSIILMSIFSLFSN